MKAYLAPGLKTIDEVIADAFDTTVDEMKAPGRKREGVDPRMFAMKYRKDHSKESLAKIGARYGRDHATTLRSCRQVEILMQNNRVFRTKAAKALVNINKLKQLRSTHE